VTDGITVYVCKQTVTVWLGIPPPELSLSPKPNNTQIVMWCYLGSWYFAGAICLTAHGTENIRL